MLMGGKVCLQDNTKTAAHTRNLLNIPASIHVGVGIAGGEGGSLNPTP